MISLNAPAEPSVTGTVLRPFQQAGPECASSWWQETVPCQRSFWTGQGGRLGFGLQIKLKNKFIWLAQKTGWPYLSCPDGPFHPISRNTPLYGPSTVHPLCTH